jgi:hypothetical protein
MTLSIKDTIQLAIANPIPITIGYSISLSISYKAFILSVV